MENPFETPGNADREFAKAKKSVWFSVLASVAAWCCAYLAGAESASGNSALLPTIILAVIASTWIYRDAKRNGIAMVGAVNYLIFFAWMIAVPIYLCYTRRRIGFVWTLLQGLGVTAAWFLGWKVYS